MGDWGHLWEQDRSICHVGIQIKTEQVGILQTWGVFAVLLVHTVGIQEFLWEMGVLRCIARGSFYNALAI